MIAKIFLYFLVSSIYINGLNSEKDCDSDIFCYGDILYEIQLSDPPIYEHSGDFVEMRLMKSPTDIKDAFKKIEDSIENDKSLLETFAEDNFEPDVPNCCSTFENKKMPGLEAYVPDKKYRNFASSISGWWSKLVVQTSENVRDQPDYHSLIHLPNCFVKSDEFTSTMNYYDSYWVFRGLMANNMKNIAAGIIENYAYLIEQHGFVLHSNRVYSTRRTQIPLLALMMEYYFSVTDDKTFLTKHLKAMETEFMWWVKNRYVFQKVRKIKYQVFKYLGHKAVIPRPETYKEDYEASKKALGDDGKIYFYSALRGLDESGFGYSGRFRRDLTRTRASLQIQDVIPVELNSVLGRYALLLSQWFRDLENNTVKGDKYEKYAKKIAYILNNVLWSNSKGMWLDWDTTRSRHHTYFSPTYLMPMFTKSYPKDKAADYSNYALEYLRKEGILDKDFNPLHWIIPTSTFNTGDHWDFPYGSLPLNLFIIEGLVGTSQKNAKELAVKFTKLLMKTVFTSYDKSKTLFKQYHAIELGKGLNERIKPKISTVGYAETNGAVLTMFEWYGTLLQHDDYAKFEPSKKFAAPIDPKTGKRINEVNDESEQSSNLAQQTLERMGSKLSNYEGSRPSSNEISLAKEPNEKKLKGKEGISIGTNEFKQSPNEPTLSELRRKQKLERKGSKPSDEFEPAPSEAVMSDLPPRKRRRRRASKKFDIEQYQEPSVTTSSEQPRKKGVRKASKKFVEDFQSSSEETVATVKTSKKKRGRKSSKLSDDEESELPLNEVPVVEPPKRNNRKRRKNSNPTRTF